MMVNKKDKSYTSFSIVRHQQLPLPPSLEKPVDFMDSYLETLKESSVDSEKNILRYKKARATRLFNEAKKISVTPLAKPVNKQYHMQQRSKPWNKYNNNNEVTDTASVVTEQKYTTFLEARKEIEKHPASEGSMIKETRVGMIVDCIHCNHRWTHFSKNLNGQYYTTCPRCHGNCRLRHYQRG